MMELIQIRNPCCQNFYLNLICFLKMLDIHRNLDYRLEKINPVSHPRSFQARGCILQLAYATTMIIQRAMTDWRLKHIKEA